MKKLLSILALIALFNCQEQPKKVPTYQIDLTTLQPSATGKSKPSIALPNAEGKFTNYTVNEFSNLDPELQRLYGDSIKSFRGDGVVISYYKGQIKAALETGEQIEPSAYGYTSKIPTETRSINCTTEQLQPSKSGKAELVTGRAVNEDGKLRRMKVLFGTTETASNTFGKTPAANLAGINVIVNYMNSAAIPDFGVQIIISSESLKTFNFKFNIPPAYNSRQKMQEMQKQFNAFCKADKSILDNTDCAMLIDNSVNVGNAGCFNCGGTDNAYSIFASGHDITSRDWSLKFPGHELWHGWGANHTHTGLVELTIGNVETGMGQTLMAYLTGGPLGTTMDGPSDYRHHLITVQQVRAGVLGKLEVVPSDNVSPVVAPIPNYIVPVGSIIELSGKATDANGDVLNDYRLETMGMGMPYGIPDSTKTGQYLNFRPQFNQPTLYRMIPRPQTSFVGGFYKWEVAPSVTKTVNFRAGAFDGKGGYGFTNFSVTYDTAYKKLKVKSQDVATIISAGSSMAVTWTKTGREAIETQIDIWLSSDGVKNDYYLGRFANNNTATATITKDAVGTFRIKLKPVGNAYLAFSKGLITITAAVIETNAPQNLTATVSGSSVILKWDAPKTFPAVKYSVYMDRACENNEPYAAGQTCEGYKGETTSRTYTLRNVSKGVHTFDVKGKAGDGLRTVKSNVVKVNIN